MLVGVSAVIIGLCALAVSLYETSLMREEQRAAVMPMLELARSYSIDRNNPTAETSSLKLHATNVGIGPARILDFRVTVDGKPQPTWNAAIRELLGREQPLSYIQSTINGRTIPPDRTIIMMDLNDIELVEDILAEFGRFEFEACYCSVFDECWRSSYSVSGTGSAVESCEPSESSFRE